MNALGWDGLGPTTRTRIYFTTAGLERSRTALDSVRGERASRSIVNRTTALWSTIITASLVLADVGSRARLSIIAGRAVAVEPSERVILCKTLQLRRGRSTS